MFQETPDGAGTTHTACGIIIQEASKAVNNVSLEFPASLSSLIYTKRQLAMLF